MGTGKTEKITTLYFCLGSYKAELVFCYFLTVTLKHLFLILDMYINVRYGIFKESYLI